MSCWTTTLRRAGGGRGRRVNAALALWAGLALLLAHGADLSLIRTGGRAPVVLAQPADDGCNATVVLETPGAAPIQGAVQITGYAYDPAATDGTGVTSVQIWLGGPPEATESQPAGTLLGEAELGQSRPDLEAAGANFTTAGFRFNWNSATAPAGPQTLYIAAQSACGTTLLAQPVLVLAPAPPPAAVAPTPPAAACEVKLVVDQPGLLITATSVVTVTGYAADPKAPAGPGVRAVGVFLDPAAAGDPLVNGTYGLTRPDATQALGDPRFGRSGYSVRIDAATIPPDVNAVTIGATPATPSCATATATLAITRTATIGVGSVTPLTPTAGVSTTTGVSSTAGVTATTRVTPTVNVTATNTITVPNSSSYGPDNVSLSPIGGTRSPTATTAVANTPPPSITGVQQTLQTGSSDTRVVVVTFAPTKDATGYVLYRGNAPNATFNEVNSAPATATTVNDIQIMQPGTYYYYVVATYAGGARSQNSNVMSVQVR